MNQTRGYARYRLGLPVAFSWQSPEGDWRQGTGFTRDISAGGVFLITRATPPQGSAISFEAFLPPVMSGAPTLRWQGAGRILRVESETHSQEWHGVAAVSSSVSLWDTQRRYQRRPIEIPIKFTWEDASGRRCQGQGFARDLSPGGFYLLARKSPPAGARLEFAAFLPPIGPGSPTLRLEGQARVLRVENEDASKAEPWNGIAAATERIELCELG